LQRAKWYPPTGEICVEGNGIARWSSPAVSAPLLMSVGFGREVSEDSLRMVLEIGRAGGRQK